MAPTLALWLGLFLPLLLTDAKTVQQPDSQSDTLNKPSSLVKLEPLWTSMQLKTGEAPNKSLPLPEMLDLDVDQPRRLARGAEEEEQQSTFSQSFENDSVTTPQDTAFDNGTKVAAGDHNDHEVHGNTSSLDPPGLFNPFYPLAEGSYAAYAVLFLAGLVLALGVVGNMAVMCIVWNNYYMRSAWNYLLASMAFWDFLVLVLCLPVVVHNQLSNRRILGDITCRMVPYMEVGGAYEELTQSVSPTSGLLVDSCSITPSSPLSLYLPDSLHSLLLKYHQGRMWWCFGCYFCLPILFTVLCQMATRNVNSDSSSTQKQRSHDDRSTNQKHQQHQALERQLNCTLLALAVVYGVCALPEHVCNITLAYANISISEETASMLALLHHFLLFFKSSVTPVLLLCLCKALGQAFMDCCCCCCQECQPNATQGSPNIKLKAANETSIFFDKAKETSAILSISS
ncbi:hypothetical protein JOQ06_007428 [Pogonophryne albipinna]|uniref:G-protein coupled receptors family 1 profile domain-containing protein n=1 Tax=Pogonophryne albipinna TaxID=1090488 RepID=A0AAD6FI73_9TELE|nr:hypothetical protein JOQ06_007428 [Pogonophryne albipinna]